MIAALLLAAAAEVPAGSAPVLDGRVEAPEWRDAAVLGSPQGLTVRAKHDGKALYLAVERAQPCAGTEEICLLLGSGEAGETPGSGDLQLSYCPFSMQRQPWAESRGDGKSWIPQATPAGWAARACAEDPSRMQFELALSLSKVPEGPLRLGILCAPGGAWPESLNLYMPSSWSEARLAGPRGEPARLELSEEAAKAKSSREAFQAAMVRFQEVLKRKEPPKSQSEAMALQQSIEASAKGFSRAAELEPANPLVRFAYGGFLSTMGEADAGRDELLAARKLAPAVPRLTERLYELDVRCNRYAEALALAEEAAGMVPGIPTGWILRGQARIALGDFGGAVEDLEKADRMPIDSATAKYVESLLQSARGLKEAWPEEEQARRRDESKGDLPRAELVMERGRIVVELFEDDAANTVASFVSLAERGYFDGTRFHRVIGDFMAQGGDPLSRNPEAQGLGSGGPGYRIRTQTSARRHWRGSLSMANAGKDTDGSQFFLAVKPLPHLDGKHAVFGRVLEGQDVVDAIRQGDRLKSVRILRKRAHEYVPEKLEEPPKP